MGSRRNIGKRTNKSKTNKTKLIIAILAVLIIVIGVLVTIRILNKRQVETNAEGEQKIEEKKEEPQVQIVDVNSKTRPYAVMINNNHSAWPQCGLKDAYIVYEIIVEGEITRMMALYKDKLPEKVGSVRSARHYFLDYAEENDAIFVHWGGSPQAYSRINTGINALDGIALEGTSIFFRDKTLKRDYEHTGFVNLAEVKEHANSKGYTRDTNKDLLLNYSAVEIDLSAKEEATSADKVELEYSGYHKTTYEYDSENKVYKRYMSGKANIDLETEEQYTTKNIIVYKVKNYTLNDGENKGRQELDNVGSGNGYYISCGYAVPITWEKSAHSSQTVYKYANGEEIVVNDGNTFIQIMPLNSEITIEPVEEVNSTNVN